MEYPTLEKLKTRHEDIQLLKSFLVFLEDEKYDPCSETCDSIILKFIGVDPKDAEHERNILLKELNECLNH